MAIFQNTAELAKSVGQPLGVTSWQTVSQERIQSFADVTGDHQWIHIDMGRARDEGPFGVTVAHGALTLSLVPVFVGELVDLRHARMTINAGLGRVRFRAPVPAGARVRGRAELLDVINMGGGTRVTVRATIEIEGERKPACVAEQVLVFHE